MKSILIFSALVGSVLAAPKVRLAPFLDQYQELTSNEFVPNQFIIKLKEQVSVSSHESFLSEFLDEHKGAKIRFKYDFADFSGYSISLQSDQQLLALRQNQDIEYVERNKVGNVGDIQYQAPWGLARISQRTIRNTNYVYDCKAGANVDVHVVDTGVNINHVEFEGRALFGACFNRCTSKDDLHGHGTHVAGTIASKTYGVAKKATIFAVAVMNADGSGSWDQVLAGLQWVLNNCRTRKRPCVANLSLAGPRSASLETAVNNMVAAGVHMVLAAGNQAVDACSQSPAGARSAYTVGSINAADTISSFSNWGTCVDIFAPGEAIKSTWKGSTTATATLSGTSMAAPHVAGVRALFLAQDPSLSPSALDTILRSVSTNNLVKNLPVGTVNRIIYTNPPASFQEESVVGTDGPKIPKDEEPIEHSYFEQTQEEAVESEEEIDEEDEEDEGIEIVGEPLFIDMSNAYRVAI